jgi:hypothetical protein
MLRQSVERPSPVWRGRLGGRHTALEQVTERLRGTRPMLAPRPSFAFKAKLCPPTSLRSAGSTSASMAYYVWPSEPLKQGFRPCERSSMPLRVRFRTDSAMTPISHFYGCNSGAPLITKNFGEGVLPALDQAKFTGRRFTMNRGHAEVCRSLPDAYRERFATLGIERWKEAEVQERFLRAPKLLIWQPKSTSQRIRRQSNAR